MNTFPFSLGAISPQAPDTDAPVAIIGAGPTGLSAAYHIGKQAMLIEAADQVGGWCRSIEDGGFTFDYAGHIMFSKDDYVHSLYKMLLGDNVHWQNREAWVYSKNVYTRYPFQGALYGLPPEVIRECIVGAIEARYGKLPQDAAKAPSAPAAQATQVASATPVAANGTSHSASKNGSNGHASNGHASNGHASNGHASNGSNGLNGLADLKVATINGNGKPDELGGLGEPVPVQELEEILDCCADGTVDSVGANCPPSSPSTRISAVPEAVASAPPSAQTVNAPASKDGASSSEPRNFEEFIYKVWGAGIAKHFAVPYNRKLWAVPLSEMETSWLGGRVPLPDLEEIIDGALQPVPAPMGPNAVFGYPLKGGFQALMDGFLPHLHGDMHLNTRVTSVSPSKHQLTLARRLPDGTTEHTTAKYSQLISTMPLPRLVDAMGDEAPAHVVAAAKKLRHVSVRCVNIGVGVGVRAAESAESAGSAQSNDNNAEGSRVRSEAELAARREGKLTEKHWIYYPEDTVFHRIFVQGNASPGCNPPGGFGLTCEITYSEYKPLPCDGEELTQRCIEECRRVGIITDEDEVWVANQVDMPYAYVVYDHDRKESVDTIREWLLAHDIVLSGRYSEWEYYNSDHAFIAGKRAAETVMEKLSQQKGMSVARLEGSSAAAAAV